MSILKDLKVTDSSEKTRGYDPIRIRRKKLAAALHDQIGLVAAEVKGERFSAVKVSRRRDLETDEVFEVERHRRVSPWWWIDNDGSVKFTMRYGSTKIAIKEGKATLVFKALPDLERILPDLRQEVLAGGLDEALTAAASELHARFKKRKAA